MTRRLGLALALCLALTAAGRPDGPPPPLPVERLIDQLGSRDFKTRETATKTLAERGEEALPALRKALPHPDPEVRQRLGQLIADTERALLLAPKRVSLKFRHAPVRDALAELSRQSGYRIELQGGGPQAEFVTLQADNVTFWEAFDKLCAQAGLVLQPHHDLSGGLMVYPQNAVVPFTDYRGPFRLAAVNFYYNKSLSFATLPRNQPPTGQRSEQLTFTFSVVAEPKLPLLGLSQPRLTAAVDDQGNSLLPTPLGQPFESNYGFAYYGYRNMVLQTQVPLAGPGNARTVKLLKGTLPVTLLAEQKPEIVVEDILKVKKKKFEGAEVTLEIEEVREAGATYQVQLTARRGGKDNQNDYTWTNSLQQRFELTDEQGHKFVPNGFNWNNGTPTSVQGTFIFGAPGGAQIGKPAKLTYYGWVTLQHQIEFEFRDLPLP